MTKLKILIIFLLAGLTYFLSEVFKGTLILPQYFHIGALKIHYYGVIMAVAIASGFYFAIKRASQYGIERKLAEDMIFWTVIGGFIGARLYHVLSSAGYYYQHPVDIFKIWNGGLSIFGAVIGGILALWMAKKISNIQFPISNLFDWLAPSVIIGQIIGRFGNLFNYEAFGYPTNLPWKMYIPEQFRPVAYISSAYYHPWFLYEALGNLVILFLLLKIFKLKFSGGVACTYLLLYNMLRFFLEFLRIDSTFIGDLRLNSLTSLVICLIALICLTYKKRHVQAP